MPGLHGIEATRRILTGPSVTAVLVLTMFEDDDTVFAAVAAGAAGYLLKGAAGGDIVAAVRAAAAGQAVFGAALASVCRAGSRGSASDPTTPFPELTGREREILDGVAAGLGNAEIGPGCSCRRRRSRTTSSTILAKLHLADRTEAIVRAREAGLGRG